MDDWTPKPGDVIYTVGPEIDYELPTADELRAGLARVVVLKGGELFSVGIATARPPVNLFYKENRAGEAVYIPADPDYVFAWKFDREHFRPTLAEAVRAQAENEVAYHEERLRLARGLLELADSLAGTA